MSVWRQPTWRGAATRKRFSGFRHRARCGPPGAAAGLLLLVACGGGGGAESGGPVELRFRSDAGPWTYSVSYSQDLDWGAAALERRYGARYTLLGARGEGGSTGARLDSLGVAVSTPHGRQTFDTRHLAGSEFGLSIAERGGTPAFSDDTPVHRMDGTLEGEVALPRLMRYAFPDLPAHPVATGDTWSASSTRTQVEAHLFVTASLSTDYTLAGHETVDGVDCVRIEGRVTGTLEAAGQRRGNATHDFAGTLEGTLVWLFDPDAGTVVSLTGDETSEGTMSTGEARTPIEQRTRIEIRRRAGEPE